MKRLYTSLLLAGSIVLLFNTHSQAGAGIFQDYIIFYEGGCCDTYRHGGQNADGSSYTFNNHNFGTVSSLLLKGGEIKSYKNGCTDVTGAILHFRVYVTGTTPPAFTEMNLPFDSNLGPPGDQRWDETNYSAGGLDVVAGRCAGNYTIEAFWRITTNSCDALPDIYDSNSGANYKAYFTVGGAYEWTGAVSSNWHTAGNWCSNIVPGNTNDVLIPNVANDPVIFSTFGDARNLTIQAGASLTVNSPRTLYIKQNLINSGVADLGYSIDFDGSSAQTVTGNVRVNRLGIWNNTSLAAGASVRVDERLALESGTFTVSAGTLTMTSDATPAGTAYISHVGGSITGNATIEMYVHNGIGNDQHLISSPMNNASVTEIGDDLSGPWGSGLVGSNNVAVTPDIPTSGCSLAELDPASNYGNLFQYNENLVTAVNSCALNGWVVRSSGNLENGRGYSAYLTANTTAEWVGAVNTGDKTVSVTKTNSLNPAADGWNILGNPYPEAIRRNDVLSGNAQLSSLQYFDVASGYSGTYQPYTSGSNIAISQAFAARTNAIGTVTFTNSMRNPVFGTSWYRIADDQWYTAKLDIKVDGNGFSDKTDVFFNGECTDDFDRMFDCVKRESRPGQPTLFSIDATGETLSLNGINDSRMPDAVFPLGIMTGAEGGFTFTIEGVETIPDGYDAFFIDKYLGQSFDLRRGNTFYYELGNVDLRDRFEIGVLESSSVTSVLDETAGDAFVTVAGSGIQIHWLGNNLDTRISVINALGQMIARENDFLNAGDTRFVNLAGTASGLYMVVFENEEGTTVKKVVF